MIYVLGLQGTLFKSKIQTGWNEKDWRKTYHANYNQKTGEVTILYTNILIASNKKCYQRQRRTFYSDRRVNLHLTTEPQNTWSKNWQNWGNRQLNNNSTFLSYETLRIRQRGKSSWSWIRQWFSGYVSNTREKYEI